jgi:cellulose synthase/poly-beta-1,6-N-acetylglucosamine synthase-like glycosyltransferase
LEYIIFISKLATTLIYGVSLLFLCAFGIHRYYLSYLYSRKKNHIPKPKGKFENPPIVTIQLPVYNEMYVVERLISSVCNIDYPKERLQIQVLDDSTDQTTEIAGRSVDYYKNKGYDIECIHRESREGYKAGALAQGLKSAKGEFVVIFDADFMPPRDFLLKTVDYFTDPEIGIVQVRWGHVNQDYSILTKSQAVLLDGHFVIEQSARFNNGLFFNFNGTAGVIRKKCIESSGGWQHDTLTEDLDLSYRAQLAGWKFVYLKDTTADAELPVDMNAFKSQQHRWAKGGVQTAFKILPEVFKRMDLPFKVKVEAFFHLLGNVSYLLLLILLMFMFPMGFFWKSLEWHKLILFNLFAISAGTLSFAFFYALTIKETHAENWIAHLIYVPVAISVGVGISINNGKAVVEALLGRKSEFRRTPKFAVTSRNDNWRGKKGYVSSNEITSLVEITVGAFFLVQTIYAVYKGYYGWIPFLLIIQFGFLYAGLLSISHSNIRKRPETAIGPIIPGPVLQRDKEY